MSLSPIFSMMNDRLIPVTEDGSELGVPRLMDICSDLGAIFLFSTEDGFRLLNRDELLPLVIEDRGTVDRAAGVVGPGVVFGIVLESLGVEIWGALAVDDTGFFLTLALFRSLTTGVVCTNKRRKLISVNPNLVSPNNLRVHNVVHLLRFLWSIWF